MRRTAGRCGDMDHAQYTRLLFSYTSWKDTLCPRDPRSGLRWVYSPAEVLSNLSSMSHVHNLGLEWSQGRNSEMIWKLGLFRWVSGGRRSRNSDTTFTITIRPVQHDNIHNKYFGNRLVMMYKTVFPMVDDKKE